MGGLSSVDQDLLWST